MNSSVNSSTNNTSARAVSKPGWASCCVPDCKRRSGTNGFRMLRFPRDFDERVIWAKQMRREDWMPKYNSRICSWHFPTNDRKCGPTRFDWDSDPDRTLRLTEKLTRSHRSVQPGHGEGERRLDQGHHDEGAQLQEKQEDVTECALCSNKDAQIERLEAENKRLKSELEEARDQLKLKFSSALNQVDILRKENAQTLEHLRTAESNSWKLLEENSVLGKCVIRYETLKLSDEKFIRLVRINLQTFHAICSILNSRPMKHAQKWHVIRIPFEDQVLIFLLKVQLKLTFQFLSILYMTTCSTMTNVFYSVLNSFESCASDNLFNGIPELAMILTNFRKYIKTFPKRTRKQHDQYGETGSKKMKKRNVDTEGKTAERMGHLFMN